MSFTRFSTLAALLLCWATPSSAQSVSLQFNNGLVSVSAQNAPVRQILAEWARLGGTTFVNAEGVPGGAVTLQLDNVTEREALDVLLRNVSGYMAAARQADAGGASTIGRILILPTSSAPRPSTAAFQPPPVPQPRPVPPFQPQFEPEFQPEPQPEFEPDPAEENPPNDVAPDEPADEPRRGRQRFVPPNVNGRPMPPQPFQPDPDDVPQDDDSNPPPSNPFGVRPGSSRPGEVTPVPDRNERDAQPQPDPEP